MTRCIIIGTGVTGIAAVEALRASDRSMEIVLIGEDPHGFYSKPGLAYYLTGEIPEKQLYLYNQQDWKALNIRYVKGHVSRLIPQAHQVEINTSSTLTYDRLLLATGATAVPMKVPGANLTGVVKLDDFEDSRRIRALARHARNAIVVGGGVIAVELIEGLTKLGVKVHYFLRGDRYWSNVLDEVESRMIEQRFIHEGVQLHFQTEAAEILGQRGKVAGVRTTNGENIRCGLIAVGIGVRPRMELAQAAGLATERGILTNEYLQTSDEDIYAAGDVAQVTDLATRHSSIDNLWWPGRQQGTLAGRNMAGKREPYRRSVAVNVLRLAGVMTSIIGAVGSGRDDDLVSVARGSSESWHQLPNSIATETGNELNHLRLMLGEKTILGALLMGEQKLSQPIQELIANQTDISPIRDRLLQPGNPPGETIMEFWSGLKEKGVNDGAP